MADASATVAIEQLAQRLERLESTQAIRDVVTAYFAACERLDGTTSPAELTALFTPDAVWSGKGKRYGAAYGTFHGRDAIVTWLAGYAGPPPHFALNAHFLGNERIAVEGDRGHGTWMMVQTSTYTAGPSDLRGARLEVWFSRDDGVWRIAHFVTENLFSRFVHPWEDANPIPVPER
jgi:ketosteroid isomerase-like protein